MYFFYFLLFDAVLSYEFAGENKVIGDRAGPAGIVTVSPESSLQIHRTHCLELPNQPSPFWPYSARPNSK